MAISLLVPMATGGVIPSGRVILLTVTFDVTFDFGALSAGAVAATGTVVVDIIVGAVSVIGLRASLAGPAVCVFDVVSKAVITVIVLLCGLVVELLVAVTVVVVVVELRGVLQMHMP